MQIILTPEEKQLYKDCIEIYGTDAQLEQYSEECLEAALTVRKFLRAKKHGTLEKIKQARVELIGEIVDTTNMSIQMKQIFCEDNIFNQQWDFKINRQINRIKEKQHT